MRKHGFNERPLYQHRPPEQTALGRRRFKLAKFRDGPINSCRSEISDIGEATADIKRLVYDFGADAVGIAKLTLCRSMGAENM